MTGASTVTPRLLHSVDEACTLLSVSRNTVLRMIREGHLTSVHIGRAIRVRAEDVERVAIHGVPKLPSDRSFVEEG